MNKARHILLTGFPTFMSRYLLWTIMENEPDSVITCIVPTRQMERAQKLIDARDDLPNLAERVRLLSGNINALDMGLSGREYLDMTEQITDVYHLASVWKTTTQRKRLYETNVVGTRNVIQAVRDLKKLNRFNHMSTAYVSGRRSGVIMEEELSSKDAFRNAYEETQYKAEAAVRALRSAYPVSIYRPSTIVGHSQTGQIDHMVGPYLFFKPLIQLPPEVPFPIPGDGSSPMNMVPVDYVVDALYSISVRPEGIGKTFHLVDPNPLAANRVFELIAKAAQKPLPKAMPRPLSRFVSSLPFLEQALQTGLSVLTDFDRWTLFNAMNTQDLTRSGPWCPPFPDYVGPLVTYLKDSLSDDA